MCKWVLALLCLLSLAFGAVAQTSSVPPLMNYQGKLTKPDGSPVEDGQYKVRFSIHDALVAGAEKWFQTMDPVLVRNGVFSVLLGSGNPLSADVFSGTRYLEIKVGDLAPLSPRQPIVSVGYSFVAQKAEVAATALTVQNGGVGTGGLADGSVTTAKLANNAVTAAKLADNSVTAPKIGLNSVLPSHLANDPGGLSRVTGGQFVMSDNGRIEAGHRAWGLAHHETFVHNGATLSRYGFGFNDDNRWTGAPIGGLSGWGGLKFFTKDTRRMHIDADGNIVGYGSQMINSRRGDEPPLLDLAIGDADTGIRFVGEGAMDLVANGLSKLEIRVDRVTVPDGIAKQAAVDTSSYGRRAMYSVEAADVRFTDEGNATIKNGYALVRLDPIFLETIEGERIVHLTPYGKESLYVSKVAPTFFVVRSLSGKGDGTFAWRLSAKRRGFANRRLESVPPSPPPGGKS